MFKTNSNLDLIKITYRICFLLGLSSATIALDVLPRYEQGHLTINRQVVAQTPSSADLQKYANAAVAIEKIRQTTYNSIQQQVDSSPQLACHKKQSFSQLPSEARGLAMDYCQQSERIVKQNGLTINQFNKITQQLRKNPELRQQLQQIMGN